MARHVSVVVDRGRFLFVVAARHTQVVHASHQVAWCGRRIAIGGSLAEQIPPAKGMTHPHDLPGVVDVPGRDRQETDSLDKHIERRPRIGGIWSLKPQDLIGVATVDQYIPLGVKRHSW